MTATALYSQPLRFFLPLIAAMTMFSCNQERPVDTIIHNATIYTVDGSFSKAEAIALRGDSIVEVGAEHQILNRYLATRMIDAEGRTVVPGLIDAHAHFIGYGLGLERLDVVGTKSFDEVLKKLDEFISSHPEGWIEGRGWDQNDWEVKEFPDNKVLNELYPDRFIVLKRVDGHAMLVNDAVLKKAGIVKGNTAVNGGMVVTDDDGEPTGVLIDAAMDLVENQIPTPSEHQLASAIKSAQSSFYSYGITSVGEPGLSLERVKALKKSLEDGQLKLRMHAMLSAGEEIIPFMEEGAVKTDQLSIRSIKVYCDGALGSRGAWLKEPYSDDSTTSGFAITPKDSLRYWAEICKRTGFQLNVHCIGDQGNEAALSVMAEVLGGTNDLRWRIEHAQVVDPDDVSLFGNYNIIPSVQPTHAISDMPWAPDRLGDSRIHRAYAYQSLKNENGLIALGTDTPVESPSTFMTFYTAVERKTADGEPVEGFLAKEALTREEALRGMTIWAAIANFQDEVTGSLEVGKKADLVILDRDWMTCDPALIPATNVLLTMINGEIVYEDL